MEISTNLKVKSTKSARNVEFNHSRIAQAAFKAVLFGCKMLIAETIKRAFHTLQALVEVTIRTKSSIKALNLIFVAHFALILPVSPQDLGIVNLRFSFDELSPLSRFFRGFLMLLREKRLQKRSLFPTS